MYKNKIINSLQKNYCTYRVKNQKNYIVYYKFDSRLEFHLQKNRLDIINVDSEIILDSFNINNLTKYEFFNLCEYM